MRAWHHHGSDTPTSPRATLHRTDLKATNISAGSVPHVQSQNIFFFFKERLEKFLKSQKLEKNQNPSTRLLKYWFFGYVVTTYVFSSNEKCQPLYIATYFCGSLYLETMCSTTTTFEKKDTYLEKNQLQ